VNRHNAALANVSFGNRKLGKTIKVCKIGWPGEGTVSEAPVGSTNDCSYFIKLSAVCVVVVDNGVKPP
jgi:hypothetical protein